MSTGVRVVFADGTTVDQIGLGKQIVGGLEVSVSKPAPGRWRVKLRNPGRAEWTATTPQVGDRIWIKDVIVGVGKGFGLEWPVEKDALDLKLNWQGFDLWHVLRDGQRRSVFPAIPLSKTEHVLTGGESVWWDVVADTMQYPDPFGPMALRARRLLLESAAYKPDRWPELQRMKALWRLSVASFDPRSTVRDFGWRLRWWGTRFSQDRVPNAVGPFDWGGMQWADGHSAQHYDLPRWCVENYIETGDQGAWELAYLMARHWASQCFIWSDVDEFQVRHAIRYEKGHMAPGELGRPGNGPSAPPRLSHAWDTGALLVAHMSGDADLLEVCRLRGLFALNVSPKLFPNGCRGFAWNLENLAAHYVMTGDQQFKDKARAEIDRAFATQASTDWKCWADDPATGETSPWQSACVLATIASTASWLGLQLNAAQQQRFAQIAEGVLEHGTRFRASGSGVYLEGAMVIDRPPWKGTLQPDIWQRVLTSNYLPILWLAQQVDQEKYRAKYEAAVRTCGELVFTTYGGTVPPIESERQADCSGWGLAGEKIAADLLWGARPLFMGAY